MKPPTRRGPGLAHLATALTGALAAAAEGAVALERYHAHAAALGLTARADALPTRVQGPAAGSAPTADHLAAAGELLKAEAGRA
ncbi:hypothetical protein [Kitasatospora sp. NPDC092286]|uniref:hypothetical protein n=1 Tax=Kitasatospora sp. NPDC092286 TaxID=3364087 RepID=UPI0038081329